MSFDAHRALAVGVLCAYFVISCTVDLFHTEECPLTTGKTAPSSDSCPACKFLAGANSTEALYDVSTMAIECWLASAPVPELFVVVSKQYTGSIILRGAPLPPIS
jgi:hypothetical protein